MPKVTIDGLEYNTEDFSSETQQIFDSMKFASAKIDYLNSKIEVLNIARNADLQKLKEILPEIQSEKT